MESFHILWNMGHWYKYILCTVKLRRQWKNILTHVCTHMPKHTHKQTQTHTHKYTHATQTHINIHIHRHTDTHICTQTHIHTKIYIKSVWSQNDDLHWHKEYILEINYTHIMYIIIHSFRLISYRFTNGYIHDKIKTSENCLKYFL